MRIGKMTPLYLLFLVGSILIILNSAFVVSTGRPVILSSSPSIALYSDWEDFKSSAVNVTIVTIFHQEPDQTVQIEAIKVSNVSTGADPQIMSYSGSFPGSRDIRSVPDRLKEWVAAELTVSNETVFTNRLLSIENINKTGSIWGHLAFGMPVLTEGGLAYVWFFFGIIILIFAIMIYFQPSRNRSLGLWIIIFSFLTFPAGGGFIVGAVLCIIFGFMGVEWTKKPKDTLLGTLFNVARLDGKSIKSLAENREKMQTAITTVILISILSSLGVGLYAYSVNLMSSASRYSGLRATYDILVRGAVFFGAEVSFGILASIAVGITKWIILSAIVYLVGAKLLGYEFKFSNMAILMAFVYIPEMLQVLTPALFTNEPFLSKGIGIGFIPIPFTWALSLFYISRLWAFAILVVAIGVVMEISRTRAIGVGLFVGTLYFVVCYMFVYPQLNVSGLQIEFSNSMETILIAASIVLVVTYLLGIFKKED